MDMIHDVSDTHLFLRESAQQKASNWIVNKDPLNLTADDEHLKQRYIFMVVFFSTGGKNWLDFEERRDQGWDSHECEWRSINCTEDGFITYCK